MDMETKSLLKEMEEKSVYAETFLERKMTGTGRQTYIHGSLYGELVRILPVIAPGLSVPAFVNNVLADHLKQHQDVINGMYREEVENGCRNGRDDVSVGASGLCRLSVI